MFRRYVSVTVLAAFAVAQGAATPHVHATAENGGHSHSPGEPPHVHLTTDDGSHCHGGHTHSHHHAAKPPVVASVQPKTQQDATPIGFTASPSGHDCDAVYLPSLTTSTPRDIAGLDSPAMVGQGLACEPAPAPLEMVGRFDFASGGPPLHGGGCALFLALRSLRI
jgi:hypothetical protein